MNTPVAVPLERLIPHVDRWLAAHSITLLRVALGFVFLLFGFLKLFPGVSPAEAVATETTSMLTLGIVGHGVALAGVAVMECTIGLCLLTGRFLGFGIALLGMALVGILSPLVLLAPELFTGPADAPNLLGQYVIKDVILAAAALVVAAKVRGSDLRPAPDALPTRRKMEIVLAGIGTGRPAAELCAEHGIRLADFVAWREELLDGVAETLVACEQVPASSAMMHRRLDLARERAAA